MIFKSESDFESALITALQSKGWEKEILQYPTEEDLLDNWADILFENNSGIDRLNDAPLTDTEMQQILEQVIALRTPLKLNGFINGKTVSITRDNPADPLHLGKEISLKIYDRLEIAAGQSRYQIVQQPIFKSKSKILHDRRGDLMLLINGMPVIHIELKKVAYLLNKLVIKSKNMPMRVFSPEFSLWCKSSWRCSPKKFYILPIQDPMARLTKISTSIGLTSTMNRSTIGNRSRSIFCRSQWLIS